MTAATASAGHHVEDVDEVGSRQRLGVILLISADVAFVLSMVFTYFYLRALNTEGGWIPDGGHTVGVGMGWVIAAVVAVSMLAYRWGEQGIRNGDQGRLLTGMLLALLLVVVDLGLQIYQLVNAGMLATEGSYASSFLALSGYHVVHLLLTLFLGLGIWNRARRGVFTEHSHWHVKLIGYWWMWVTAAALLTAFTTSFVRA